MKIQKVCGPQWGVDTSTSQGHNFCIQSLFGALNTSLEISNREERFSTGPVW
jgi:hypothetical protein